MKWPNGRPGQNGDNLASGQKPVNQRKRDISYDGRGSADVGGRNTEQQQDRRSAFKSDRPGTNMPPRPGAMKSIRQKKTAQPNGNTAAAPMVAAVSSANYQKREVS